MVDGENLGQLLSYPELTSLNRFETLICRVK